MKILVIDEEFPYPLDTGKRIRSFNLLRRIASRHTLYYIGYGNQNSEAFAELEKNNMNPVAVPRKIPPKSGISFYVRILANIFSSLPYIVSTHYSDLFQNFLCEAIDRIRPDLLLCEWSPYAIFLNKLTGVKKVIVAHNIEHRIWQRYYDNEISLLKKWYIKHQLDKLTAFEQQIFSTADGIIVVSDLEKEYVLSFCRQNNVQVIENGVDLQYFSPSADQPVANSLVFVGSMNWRPNQDAVNYFVSEIFPIIKKKIPDLTVNLVGKEPPKQLLRLNKREGINVVGGVPDVRPYVNSAEIYIVPLRIGGGTRLKILEALAMAKPVVATSIGAEGLQLADRENILLADTPQQFATMIQQALTDKSLSKSLAANGRKLVRQRYCWDSIVTTMERFLIGICSGKTMRLE